MNALKGLALTAALLVVTTSLVIAQAQGSNGPNGQLTTSTAAADNPPARPSRAARHHGTKHHGMYMMSVNRTHKGSKLTPSSNGKPQMKQ
jgi:Tfp pilus assembly protein PilN